MLKQLTQFIGRTLEHHELICSLAMREIRSRYVGSFLGGIWTFLQPLVMITVYWFVFSVGFRSRPMGDVPFVVWLTAGMAPWFVFSEVVTGAVTVIPANANLIKKTLFPSQILPVVKTVSSINTHLVFLVLLLALLFFQGMPYSLWFFQFLYYFTAMCVLALGIGWAVSALNVFVRDVGQIVGVVIQIGFWATPIFWNIQMMPEQIRFFLKFNPLFYIVQGYRESFISFVPFWHHPVLTLYFWLVAGTFFVTGALVFNRLKPQFADVL